MSMRSPLEIAKFLECQPVILSILKQVEALSIEDCWVGAGLIRNAIWNHLHGRSVELLLDSDVDVVYWDPGDATPERDIAIEKHLFEERADIPWSVHNQARMHERNGRCAVSQHRRRDPMLAGNGDGNCRAPQWHPCRGVGAARSPRPRKPDRTTHAGVLPKTVHL
jgi:hypothetical protein